MRTVDIRTLDGDASALVAAAAAGETIIITDAGRPVAQLTAIPRSRIATLIETGRARPARRRLTDLPEPEPGPNVSALLAEMRDAERY